MHPADAYHRERLGRQFEHIRYSYPRPPPLQLHDSRRVHPSMHQNNVPASPYRDQHHHLPKQHAQQVQQQALDHTVHQAESVVTTPITPTTLEKAVDRIGHEAESLVTPVTAISTADSNTTSLPEGSKESPTKLIKQEEVDELATPE